MTMTTHKPHLSLSLVLSLLTLIHTTTANTEKVIFTAPPPISLDTLSSSSAVNYDNLPVLGPSTSFSIRTNLTRIFPPHIADDKEQGDEQQRGYPSWLVLKDLTPGQRYELRVCWSALKTLNSHDSKEPTEFSLDIYPLTTILSSPHLLQSLSHHTTSLSPLTPNQPPQHQQNQLSPNETSILLLRVLAAADYFSHHQSLMKDPPPVLVDLILDPYIYNVLPQSLVPTVCYLLVVGIASWFVARWAAKSLAAIAASDEKEKKQN
ncbi:hypothetical protein V8C26DRAFT_427680 [Trichoderma gracile]